MNKVFSFIILIVILVLSVFNLYSQSPAGEWVNTQYGIKLVLNANYTYTLTHSRGQSHGQWRGNGNQLCFYDSSGAQPVCYTIVAYNANIMSMRDMNGATLTYTRKSVNSSSVNKNYGNNSDRVLAYKNNTALKYSDFMHGIDLAQFIIGGKIKPS
jgi:hypothetical protein